MIIGSEALFSHMGSKIISLINSIFAFAVDSARATAKLGIGPHMWHPQMNNTYESESRASEVVWKGHVVAILSEPSKNETSNSLHVLLFYSLINRQNCSDQSAVPLQNGQFACYDWQYIPAVGSITIKWLVYVRRWSIFFSHLGQPNYVVKYVKCPVRKS